MKHSSFKKKILLYRKFFSRCLIPQTTEHTCHATTLTLKPVSFFSFWRARKTFITFIHKKHNITHSKRQIG